MEPEGHEENNVDLDKLKFHVIAIRPYDGQIKRFYLDDENDVKAKFKELAEQGYFKFSLYRLEALSTAQTKIVIEPV